MVTELKEVIAKVERLNNSEQKQIATCLKEKLTRKLASNVARSN